MKPDEAIDLRETGCSLKRQAEKVEVAPSF